MKPVRKRIVAAMSGGVDSSVTAALLLREGFEVIGITLQLYDAGNVKRKGACCAGQDIYDAKRVAEKLGIAHYVLDYEQRFRERVIADFAASYAQGQTPIPCIRCNERVKFADLMDTARDLGADALATGHYVRRVDGANGAELHRAIDETRDQSYFLFATTRAQLSYLRFPLGGMEKPQVRAIAAELGLINAEKPDSQDICFVADGGYANIVEKLKPDAVRAGDIVDQAGRVLGRHDGVIHFTVGQRKGLGLSGNGEPLFVLSLDAAQARVVVGPREFAPRTEYSIARSQLVGGSGGGRRLCGESAIHARPGARPRDDRFRRHGPGRIVHRRGRHRTGPSLRLLQRLARARRRLDRAARNRASRSGIT